MRGTLARLFPLLAVACALILSACGRDRLPEVIPARASAERAVVVIVDGSVKARIRQLRRRLATAEVRGDVQ